jgi:hypothetical protein
MAFLDNSGDIILDAVLTDTGRFRLAKGDGTFRIAKFAFGDDEINYNLYDKNNASGSAYYDLDILQSPVFEAFTNNTSLLKSKLISIPRTNLLYLPIIKLFDTTNKPSQTYSDATTSVFNTYIVAVDSVTQGAGNDSDSAYRFLSTGVAAPGDGADTTGTGILGGFDPAAGANWIETHQGLDTNEIPPTFTIDSDLQETQYIIEIDNRLGSIVSERGNPTPVSFVDDDNVASYFITLSTGGGYVGTAIPTGRGAATSPIAGPRGTSLRFKIKASIELATSTFLFTKLGSTFNDGDTAQTSLFYYIDTIVRVTGATTGYRIDIPVRFAKAKTT